MKMGDGGFRPAYNLQFGTETESQIVIGLEVVTVGTDSGQLAPMVEQIEERYGQTPEAWLVDGGYPTHVQIDTVSEQTTVYAPVPQAKDKDIDSHQPKAKDSPAVAKWRQQMATDEAKALYKVRARRRSASCPGQESRPDLGFPWRPVDALPPSFDSVPPNNRGSACVARQPP